MKRILDILGWLGVAFVAVAVVLWWRGGLERYVQWAAIAGLVCILLYAAAQWRQFAQVFSRRGARLGTAAVTSVLVAAGILVAVNYIASGENKRWDLTTAREYTLSDQTEKLLSKLDAPLKMMVFAPAQTFDRYRLSLAEYAYGSKKVSVAYIDPDRNPQTAEQYQVQTYPTIVLAYKGRTERVTSDSEQDLANGLIKAITGGQKKVYFVQGHGEHDTASSDRRAGYSLAAAALGRDNYSVDKLLVAQQEEVPADAAIVVIAGPKTDLLPTEVDRLRQYLQKGGKLLMMLDPPQRAESPALTNLLGLAHEWDIAVNNDIVVDLSGIGQLFGMSEAAPVAAPPYPSFPITDDFRLMTAFPLTRSVTTVAGGVGGHNAQPFVQTGPNSFATDMQKVFAAKGQVKLDPASDRKGPITIAAAVSAPVAGQPPVAAAKNDATEGKPKPETRVAVFGDSDFASNAAFMTQGNGDLFMNTINWLAQQENLISIRPREPEDRRLTMTVIQQRNLLLLSLIVIPALIFASGVYTWWRRR